MKTIGNRITISDEVANLIHEGKQDTEVDFTYIQVQKLREKTIKMPIKQALKLAEERMRDKRYKNYEVHIG